jgi:hypothetical protein
MKHLTPVWFGIMLASGAIASSAVAVPAATPSHFQPATVVQADSSISESIATQQLTQFSDVLMGVLYFGLPCSFLLAVLVHNHREAQRQQLAAKLVPIRVKSRS